MPVNLVKKIITQNKNEIQLLKAESHSCSKGKMILFIGVFHGDEPEGEQLILNLISEINKNPSLASDNTVLFIRISQSRREI